MVPRQTGPAMEIDMSPTFGGMVRMTVPFVAAAVVFSAVIGLAVSRRPAPAPQQDIPAWVQDQMTFGRQVFGSVAPPRASAAAGTDAAGGQQVQPERSVAGSSFGDSIGKGDGIG